MKNQYSQQRLLNNNIYFRTLKNINRKTGENTLIIKEFYDGQVAKINTIYNGEKQSIPTSFAYYYALVGKLCLVGSILI